MSKREEISNTRISPRALQRKLSAISRQRSVNEGSKESRRPRDSSTEDLGLTRGSRAEKSVSIDERQVYEKYTEIVSQLSCFYELFRSYAMNKDIKEKLIGVISEDKEEDPLQMLKYMNYTVGLLLDSDQPEKPKSGEFQSGPNNDYEELLQKAENDIRQHIRIEQQMKLLIDGLQAKVDEYEKDNPSDEDSSEKAERVLKEKIENSQLIDTIKEKEEEIASMQKTLKQKEELIKSLEEKTLSIAILEHTLKSQKESHKKDKENIRNYYEQELANVTKEIQHIQRVLAINLASDDKVQLLQEELLSSKDFNIKKVQLLENRIRQLGDTPLVTEREETEPTVMYTDPGFDIDRRYSVRPSATASSIMRSRGYDLKSHRCSTDMFQKNSENRPTKHSPQKKKKDVINELRATTALGTRYLNKNSFREQPQQGPTKMQKDCENYFNYLKRKIDNLPQTGDREREHLRSFDARRSNSVKKGVYLAGAAGMVKDKSVDRLAKADMSRTHDERSESLADKHTKSVPKLLRNTATSTAYAKLLKH